MASRDPDLDCSVSQQPSLSELPLLDAKKAGELAAVFETLASVRPHSVMEIYMLVASSLSPSVMAWSIFSHSSAVGSRFIEFQD